MSLHQIYDSQCPHGGENIGCGAEAMFLQNTANHLLDKPMSTYK